MDSPIDRNVAGITGGLDRPTLVVAGVATLGLIMAVLDTTIVKTGAPRVELPRADAA